MDGKLHGGRDPNTLRYHATKCRTVNTIKIHTHSGIMTGADAAAERQHLTCR